MFFKFFANFFFLVFFFFFFFSSFFFFFFLAPKAITESADVVVTQNEWTLAIINNPSITESAGVAVSQSGSAVGTLKVELTGATTSVVITAVHGVTLVDSADLLIGGTTLVLANINTATHTQTAAGTLKTALQNEWTLAITPQAITENVGVTVSQNEWTLAITSQSINAIAGVTVTQGTATGTLKTALSGGTSTSVVISVAAGVEFVSGVEVVIDSGGSPTTVSLGNVNTATKTVSNTGTLKTALQNEWTLTISNGPSIEQDAGVTVTQGASTGILKTTLTGTPTSVIVTAASGVTFVTGAAVDIGSTTVVLADVTGAVNNGATENVVVLAASGVEFSASSNIVIGSTTVVLDRVTSATNSLTTSSLVIQTLKGVTFVASADVMVGSTALAFGNVASSTQTKVATTIPANNIGAATKLISYANYTFCDDCDGNGGISCDCIAGTALDQNSNNICIWLGGVIDNVRAPPNRVTRTLQIIVTNVNEPPVLNFTQVSLTVMENSPGGTPLGKVSAKDPDNVNVANPTDLQSLSFFITTDLAATSYPTAAQADPQTQLSCYNQVCIHRETGLLSVNGNGPPLDYEANQDGNFVFYVRAEDNGGNCLGTVPDLGNCYVGK